MQAYYSFVDVFFVHLRIEIPQNQLCQAVHKEVIHFGGCMSANYADVVKFAFYSEHA